MNWAMTLGSATRDFEALSAWLASDAPKRLHAGRPQLEALGRRADLGASR